MYGKCSRGRSRVAIVNSHLNLCNKLPNPTSSFLLQIQHRHLPVHKTETELDAGGFAHLSIYKALWQRLKLSQRPTPANAHQFLIPLPSCQKPSPEACFLLISARMLQAPGMSNVPERNILRLQSSTLSPRTGENLLKSGMQGSAQGAMPSWRGCRESLPSYC